MDEITYMQQTHKVRVTPNNAKSKVTPSHRICPRRVNNLNSKPRSNRIFNSSNSRPTGPYCPNRSNSIFNSPNHMNLNCHRTRIPSLPNLAG